ncbi:hypothetical protein BZA77DRAFT_298002 [Pyronema omphalodes]|nr:hypothetical protein BZA77DRAFT_298002 [Pyronema omphalodes]
MAPKPCVFFLQNRCTKGSSCTFSHAGSWRASGQPPPRTEVNIVPRNKPPERLFVPCKFFQNGYCSRGTSCLYAHVAPIEQPTASINAPDRVTEVEQKSDTIIANNIRVLGATLSVTFGQGLEISSITSASATSIITIHNLPTHATSDTVREILSTYDRNISPDSIRIIPLEDCTYATAKLCDIPSAEKAIKSLNGMTYEHRTLTFNPYRPKGLSNSSQSATQVICSWFPPSKIATVRFNTSAAAQNTVRTAQGKLVRGRAIDVQLHNVDRNDEVTVGNLSIKTTDKDLRFVMGKDFKKANFHPPNYDESEEEIMVYIVSLLGQKVDEIVSYDLMPTTKNDRKIKAIVKFKSAANALKAVQEHNGKKMGFLGNGPLYLNLKYTASFKISPAIYKAVAKELTKLTTEYEKAVRIKIFGAGTHNLRALTTVRITGQSKSDISAVKLLVSKIVRGEPCRRPGTGELLWAPFFATPAGINFVTLLALKTNTYIYADRRKSQLFLFGSPEDRQTASREILDKFTSIEENGNDIALQSSEWRYVMRGGLQALQQRFGDKISINASRRCLVLKGTPSDVSEVRTILASRAPGNETRNDVEGECPICFDTAENPTKFGSCDHFYCQSCLVSYLKSTLDTHKFPLMCIGESRGAQCNSALDFKVAAGVLSPSELDSILDAAFTDYIRRKPEEYAYCPTPNCDTVYCPTKIGSVFSCVDCLLEICTNCKVEAHDGMSCEEYKISKHDDKEAEEQFQKWKKNHGIQSCPKCKTDIEKISGCNHMTCATCRTHICWVCLKTFESSGPVYDHMNEKHGGIGIEYY